MKLRLRSTRLAKTNWLELKVENIPEKQVSGSHICNTWNLTLRMMHHCYLKTGKCWVQHTSGQNSSNLLLHSQLAPPKNEPQNNKLVMGHFQQIFLNSKAQCSKQVSGSWCFPALVFPSFTSKGMLSPWPSFHLQAIEFIELLVRFSAGFDSSWLKAEPQRGRSLRRALVSTLQDLHSHGSSSPTSQLREQ